MSDTIIKMEKDNYEEVQYIYKQGIDGGISTFQKEVPNWERFDMDHIEKCGFRKIGFREKVAQMPNGGWRDEFLFEKRLDNK